MPFMGTCPPGCRPAPAAATDEAVTGPRSSPIPVEGMASLKGVTWQFGVGAEVNASLALGLVSKALGDMATPVARLGICFELVPARRLRAAPGL